MVKKKYLKYQEIMQIINKKQLENKELMNEINEHKNTKTYLMKIGYKSLERVGEIRKNNENKENHKEIINKVKENDTEEIQEFGFINKAFQENIENRKLEDLGNKIKIKRKSKITKDNDHIKIDNKKINNNKIRNNSYYKVLVEKNKHIKSNFKNDKGIRNSVSLYKSKINNFINNEDLTNEKLNSINDINNYHNNISQIVKYFDDYISLIAVLNNTFSSLNESVKEIKDNHIKYLNSIMKIDNHLTNIERRQSKIEKELEIN